MDDADEDEGALRRRAGGADGELLPCDDGRRVATKIRVMINLARRVEHRFTPSFTPARARDQPHRSYRRLHRCGAAAPRRRRRAAAAFAQAAAAAATMPKERVAIGMVADSRGVVARGDAGPAAQESESQLQIVVFYLGTIDGPVAATFNALGARVKEISMPVPVGVL